MEQQKPITIPDIVMASIQAENLGVQVDWKQTCLKIVQAIQEADKDKDTD
jgi:hypothetical protein